MFINRKHFVAIYLTAIILLINSSVWAQEKKIEKPENLDQLLLAAKESKTIATEDIENAKNIIQSAANTLPAEEILEKLALLQEYRQDEVIPAVRKPLRDSDLLDRLILSIQLGKETQIDPAKIKIHPAAAGFPGLVPDDAPRVKRTMELNLDRQGWHNVGIYGNPGSPYWHSTGLYAAPGELITVTVPKEFAGKGLMLRIGCHSDRLWRLNSWKRAPSICSRYNITETTTKIANSFGGLIYVESNHEKTYGKVKLTFENAVESPFYELGKTSLEEWKKIRNNPGPWAELASGKLIITVPSKVVRKLDNPQELMEFWDGIMDNYADLLGRDHNRKRTERFVCDVQISAGYMHSGYPLMAGLDIAETFCNVESIQKNNHGGIWGLFHEIGHNHQRREWTFSGTTEVTVNLFSLYMMEKACGLQTGGHPGVAEKSRQKSMERYFANGSNFEQWQKDPFLALCMYIQLQQEFGWEPFTATFKQYLVATRDELPRSDQDKRDQWMVRFSKTVGKNLGPFFQVWGVPTTKEARDSIADLPEWMPKDLPDKKIS
ncbi:MAG: hypothetical protein JEZ07_11345 [Phycisphaerae bacterium]|nr:hypothetical protein [Phycisphaerae bacterium]